MIQVGTPLPDFSVQTDTGETLTADDVRGRWAVIYFYPKDDTPGCTKEACEFRDLMPRFEGVDAMVLGVSRDSVESHAAFKERYGLSFPLLADVDGELLKAFEVTDPDALLGAIASRIKRCTFLIAPDGRVARVWKSVNPIGHAAKVADAIREATAD